MAVNQRPQWTAVEIASHAMDATSLSQLTLPEVKRMAARILADAGAAPQLNSADPASALNKAVLRAMRDDGAEM